MYSIYADGACVYDSVSPNKEFKIVKGKLKLGDSVAGSLSFTIDMSNACYNSINKLITKVVVYKDRNEIWSGRVMEESVNFWNQKTFECEGELAYLNDTIQPQEKYSTSNPITLLTAFLAVHNENVDADKKFEVGVVTVQDPQDELDRYTNYETTIDTIKDKLVDPFKAHLRVRKEGGHRYLDLIRDEDCRVSQQTITFGSNLLDFTKNLTTEDYATVLVPRGAQLDESEYDELTEYLTVAEATGQNGSIYVTNDEAVQNYGWIEKVHDFENITDPNQLLSAARKYLNSLQIENIELEVSAIDLSTMGSNTYFSGLANIGGDSQTETLYMDNAANYFKTGDLVEIYWGNESLKRILLDVRQGASGQPDEIVYEFLDDHQWVFENEFVAIRTIDAIDDIRLLDKIRVVSPPHGIDAYFPVNKVELDLCNPENDEYVLGTNVQNTLTSYNTNSSKEVSGKIKNIPTMSLIVNQAKAIATSLINMATNGIVTIAKNENNTEELIVSDKLNYKAEDAKVWRFNFGGLMYSSHGYYGTADTAITMNGEIVADFIKTGKLDASLLTVGKIQDLTGKSYWDLETGKLVLNSESIPIVNLVPSIYWSEARYSVNNNPYTQYGITWTLNGDGSVTANGTATAGAAYYISNNRYDDYGVPIKLDPNRTYFLSGCPAGGSSTTYRLVGRRYDENMNLMTDNYRNDYGEGVEVSGAANLYVFIYISDGATVNNLTFYPMLEYGGVRHEYVSTHGGSDAINNIVKSSITQTASEIRTEVSETYQTLADAQVMNLVPSVYWSEARYGGDPYTQYGLTWTLNSDGSVTVNGTATTNAPYRISHNGSDEYGVPIRLDPAKKYTLSGCPSGGAVAGYCLRCERLDASGTSLGTVNDIGDGILIDSGTYEALVYIRIANGTTVNNVRFYPMLEAGTIKHGYISTHNGTGAINNSIKTVKSSITQTASEIRTEVSETYQTLENTQVMNLVPSVYWSEARYGSDPYTQVGITWTLNADGSITASGTATALTAYYISNNQDDQYGSPIKVDPAKKYMLSGCPAGGSTSKYAIRCQRFDSSGTSLGVTYDTGDGLLIAEGTYSLYLYLVIYNGVTVDNIRFDPMLEAGSIKHGYISTHNGTTAINNNLKSVRSSIQQNADSITSIVEASVFQNLMPALYYRENVSGKQYTTNGITYTVNSDGSITANGTATAVASFALVGNTGTSQVPYIVLDPEKKYVLSGCPAGGSSTTYCIRCQRLDSSGTVLANLYDTGEGVSINGSNTYAAYMYIRIGSGTTVSNLTFYPMFESGSVIHKYVNPRVYSGETVASMINQTATSIKISASHISLEGLVTANNNVTIDTSGKITAVNADISGKITVGSNSSAAGFSIDNNSISYGTMGSANSVFICSTGSNAYANIAGSGSINGWVYTAGTTFGVTKAGTLYCTGAHISGAITATSGTFNGTINASGGSITGDMSITGSLSCGNTDGGVYANNLVNISQGYIQFKDTANNKTSGLIHTDVANREFIIVASSPYMLRLSSQSSLRLTSSGDIVLGGASTTGVVAPIIYSTTGAGSYVRVSSDGTLGSSSSSLRYKHNIKDASDDYYDGLLDVKPSTFVYNSDKSNKTVTGLIAEDLEKHFPVSVLYNSEGLVNDWDDRMVLTGTLALLQKLYKRVDVLDNLFGRMLEEAAKSKWG